MNTKKTNKRMYTCITYSAASLHKYCTTIITVQQLDE